MPFTKLFFGESHKIELFIYFFIYLTNQLPFNYEGFQHSTSAGRLSPFQEKSRRVSVRVYVPLTGSSKKNKQTKNQFWPIMGAFLKKPYNMFGPFIGVLKNHRTGSKNLYHNLPVPLPVLLWNALHPRFLRVNMIVTQMRETMQFALSFIGLALLSLRRDSVLYPQVHRVNIIVPQERFCPSPSVS